MRRILYHLTILLTYYQIQIQASELLIYHRTDSETYPNSLWKNSSTRKTCKSPHIEFNIELYGVYAIVDGEINNIKITSIPPHFQLNFRIDSFHFDTWDSEYIRYIVSGREVYSFIFWYKDAFNAANKFQHSCSNGAYPNLMYYFYRSEFQVADQNDQLSLSINSNCDTKYKCESVSNESYGIGQMQIFVNTCHPKCLTCTGSTENDCKTCSYGIPNNGQCQCPLQTNYFYQGQCVTNCPLGTALINGFCLTSLCSNKCLTCNPDNYQCQACNPPYYQFKGQCLIKCPLLYPSNTDRVCVDSISQLPGGIVFFEGLQNDWFSRIQIEQLGFQIQNLKNSENSAFFYDMNSIYTICQNVQLLGGYRSGVQGTKIINSIAIMGSHKFKKLSFKFYIIDYSKQSSFQNLILKINNIDYPLNSAQYINTTSNLCGLSYLDAACEFSINLEDTSSTLSFEIDNNSPNVDIGIRDFIVAGYSCTQDCDECNINTPSICTKCQSGYFNNSGSCLQNCPSGTYTDTVGQQCVLCSATFLNCQLCIQNECTKCDTLSHLTKLKQCLKCNVGLYFDPVTETCTSDCGLYQTPDSISGACVTNCANVACYQCNSDPLKCSSCYSKNYLYQDNCYESCPLGTSPLGNICKTCSSSQCLVCDTTLDPSPCQQCPTGYYLTSSNNCLICDTSCKTCQDFANKCTSCNNQLDSKIILDGNQCKCNSPYYSFSSNQCKPICNDEYKTPEEQCEISASQTGAFQNSIGCVNCQIQAGFQCLHIDPYPLDTCLSSNCGDGVLDSINEQCDDDNNVNGDGCSLDCQIELGYDCVVNSNDLSICSEKCGNGYVTQSEECDESISGYCISCKIQDHGGCFFTQVPGHLNVSYSTCKSCTDINCKKCKLTDNVLPQICIQCDNHYFIDSSNGNICTSCHSSCMSCTGPNNNQCTSCDNSIDNRVILDPITNQCICDSIYYSFDPTIKKCVPICHDNYKTSEEQCEVDSTLFDNSLACINCQIQSNYVCLANPNYTLYICKLFTCGNGILDSNEQCDDGNEDNSDKCTFNCQFQQGYTCTQTLGKNDLVCNSVCGDKIKTTQEECDSIDLGCTIDCKIKDNYGCYLEVPVVSGGIQNQRCFQCPDSNCKKCEYKISNITGQQEKLCEVCFEGYSLNQITNQCEKCDHTCKTCDGTSSNNCLSCFMNDPMVYYNSLLKQCNCNSPYYQIDTSTKNCVPICGDKYKTIEEECEVADNNFDNALACINCKIQQGYKCIQLPNFTLDICIQDTCLNGILDPKEECDDGNQIGNDSCSLNCKINLGYKCTQIIGQQDLQCSEICGDGVRTKNEECDSLGNGCKNCKIEIGYGCEDKYQNSNLISNPTSLCFVCSQPNCKYCEKIGGSEICLNCLDGYYKDPITMSCLKCHDSCQNCKGGSSSQCTSCPINPNQTFSNGQCIACDIQKDLIFNPKTKQCQEKCGKGYIFSQELIDLYQLSSQLECDDGNNLDNDGCSAQCIVEERFKCLQIQSFRWTFSIAEILRQSDSIGQYLQSCWFTYF